MAPTNSSDDPFAAFRAMALPAAESSDFHLTLHSKDQDLFFAVAGLCIAIPAIFLLGRIYTKLAIVRGLEAADYLIFLSFPLLVVEIILGNEAVKWGSGVHQWRITAPQFFKQLYWLNAAEIVYCPTSFLVKMAILTQYLRLFAPDRRNHMFMWWGSWIMIAMCFIFYGIFAIWTAFYCYPRQKIWNKAYIGGKCHDHSPIVISQSIFNMVTDLIILFLPTFELWKLNVPMARKIVITLLFGTGLLACVATALRIAYVVKIEDIYLKADVSHNGFYLGLWTIIEVALAFVAACALSLPRLIQAKRKKITKVVAAPFSSLRSTVKDTSSNGTLKSQSEKSASLGGRSISPPVPQDPNPIQSPPKTASPPMSHGEIDYLRAQQSRLLNPIIEDPRSRGVSPSGSSRYSSKRNSIDNNVVQPLNVAHSGHARKLSNHQAEYVGASEPWNSDPWSVSTNDLNQLPAPVGMPMRQNSIPRKPLAEASSIDARMTRWPSKIDTHRSLAPEPDSTSASEQYSSPILHPYTYTPPAPAHVSVWPAAPPPTDMAAAHYQYHPAPPQPPPQPQPLTPVHQLPPPTPGPFKQYHDLEPAPPVPVRHERRPSLTPMALEIQPLATKHQKPQQQQSQGEILLPVSYSQPSSTKSSPYLPSAASSPRPLQERMTVEEIEAEMDKLQQFRFEEMKNSLEGAVRGRR